jgi:hypothetical protein
MYRKLRSQTQYLYFSSRKGEHRAFRQHADDKNKAKLMVTHLQEAIIFRSILCDLVSLKN